MNKQLETLEDYEREAAEFVLPFLRGQIQKIATEIEDLHALMLNSELTQEEIDHHINAIKQYTNFASPKSPMFPFFQNITLLEDRLIEQGLLK